MLHIFITNKQTLKLHLEYLFAGVGMKMEISPFLYKSDINFNPVKEKTLVSMLADLSRIREGDKIVFYLQGNWQQKGKFFGIFTAASEVFFDENDSNNFLINELGKGLPYRILVKGWKVFPKGIEERELLDDISGRESPWQLCWSLIYRKLKGHRGCVMLTEYEEKDLTERLGNLNNNKSLVGENFSFDEKKEEIILSSSQKIYTGRLDDCSIKERLLYKLQKGFALETHLQAYILQNFDSFPLKEILFPLPLLKAWIGNEVACGAGMQRIDLLIKQEDEKNIFIKAIELKDEKIKFEFADQKLFWYIKWILWYLVPSYLKFQKRIVIIPCIIASGWELLDYEKFWQKYDKKTSMRR